MKDKQVRALVEELQAMSDGLLKISVSLSKEEHVEVAFNLGRIHNLTSFLIQKYSAMVEDGE